MSKEMGQYSEVERTFYFHLGLLSTKFAEVEANVISLLGGLITDDLFLINPIIERNSLSQNIDLLRKINLYKEFEASNMKLLISKITKIRQLRNLFIHGLWAKPSKEGDEIAIDCLEKRVTPKMITYGRMWLSAKEHSFQLSDISSHIEELDSILELQKSLLEKID